MNQPNVESQNNVEERILYAVMIPNSTNFYIGHCQKDQLKSAFQRHYYGELYQTKDAIEEIKTKDLHPCLFRLEQLACTKKEAFRYVVAWSKIFQDAGYTNLNQGNVSVYIDNLLDETFEIYQKRKDRNIPQIITCNECCVAYYNNKRCPFYTGESNKFIWADRNERSKQVKTYVSPEEYGQIQRNAKACGKTVSAYLRETALNMAVINIDDSNATLRTEAVCATFEEISQLVYKIMRNDTYVPADLTYVLEKAKEMIKVEKSILKEQQEHIDHISKKICQTVEDIVQKKINQRGDLL